VGGGGVGLSDIGHLAVAVFVELGYHLYFGNGDAFHDSLRKQALFFLRIRVVRVVICFYVVCPFVCDEACGNGRERILVLRVYREEG
ncbi:hypothetical protein GP486_007231, partial [Trichoglossum hirsutum]